MNGHEYIATQEERDIEKFARAYNSPITEKMSVVDYVDLIKRSTNPEDDKVFIAFQEGLKVIMDDYRKKNIPSGT